MVKIVEVMQEWDEEEYTLPDKNEMTDVWDHSTDLYGYTCPTEEGFEIGLVDQWAEELAAFVDWRKIGGNVITPIMVAIRPKYRGAGLAQVLYDVALEKDYIIRAGDLTNVQSIGGARIWTKFLNPRYQIEARQRFVWNPAIKINEEKDGFLYSPVLDLYNSEALIYLKLNKA